MSVRTDLENVAFFTECLNCKKLNIELSDFGAPEYCAECERLGLAA